MSEPLYLVTAATGKTGGAVVRLLRERNLRVRAAVHKVDSRSAALEALGAQIVVADAFDPGAFDRAMQGVQRAYYCPPWHPHMLQAGDSSATR